MNKAKVQQMVSMDESDAAGIGDSFISAIVDKLNLRSAPGSEITLSRERDTAITTLWHKNIPVAMAIRQRDDHNYTVLTTVEVDENRKPFDPKLLRAKVGTDA